jgi:lysozyme family protein
LAQGTTADAAPFCARLNDALWTASKRIYATRVSFMRSLEIWKAFGRGRARRVAETEAKGMSWALMATIDNRHLQPEAPTLDTGLSQPLGI